MVLLKLTRKFSEGQRSKMLSIGFIAIIFIVIGINAFKKNSPEGIYTKVKKGRFDITILASGELQAERSEDIMAPQEMGNPMLGFSEAKIQDLVPEGTVVDSGDYVATLDRSGVSIMLSQVEAQIEASEEELKKKLLDSMVGLREERDKLLDMKYNIEELQIALEQSKYEPPTTIRQAKISLEKELRANDQAKRKYELSVLGYKSEINKVKSQLTQMYSRRDQIQELMGKFRIHAKQPGMVIYATEGMRDKRKVGSVVTPWDRVVAKLPDMTKMQSKSYINELDISKIKIGQKVLVSLDAFPEKNFNGEVVSIGNMGEQFGHSQAKVFEVIIKLNDSDRILKPGMTTSNTIMTASYDNVLSIPLETLYSIDSIDYVFTKEKYKQQVKTGNSNNDEIIIEMGLEEGDELWLNQPEDADNWRFKSYNLKNEIAKK